MAAAQSRGKEFSFLGRVTPKPTWNSKALETEPQVPFLWTDWLRLRRANWLDAMQRYPEAQALYAEIKLKKPAALAQFEEHPFPDGPHDVLP